ncbi:hypothetical protein [Klebsiella quasipneumoniae]|uniref:hypothetical protein n=1 Tax=Klebsiella quasipneumoniae TaxID=1463165 RepID=UPI001D17ED5E|nr:hypothetical protein [Klebsiella quasipneumoniae]
MGEIKTQLAEEAAADKAGTTTLAQQTAPVNERLVPDNPPSNHAKQLPELSVPAAARAPEAPARRNSAQSAADYTESRMKRQK